MVSVESKKIVNGVRCIILIAGDRAAERDVRQ